MIIKNLIIEKKNKNYLIAIALFFSQLAISQSFFVPTTYRGAFAPAPEVAWTDSWTNWDPQNTVYPAATETITLNITTNTTWTSDKVYLISGQIYVKNNSTLTIEAGTTILVKKTGIPDGFGLVVTRGSKLNAIGTAIKPIIFTSDQPAGNRLDGDWGGIVLLGKAYTNAVGGAAFIEGITPTTDTQYGGGTAPDNTDNSGTLSFVRIEFSGQALQPDKEINGLTMGAVGSGTSIDHIQTSYVGDDGFEWFGGSVNCKYLVSFRNTDDDFDTDNGYSGNVQFGLAVRDPLKFDGQVGKGTTSSFESDNDATGTVASPQTSATFANMTIIGPKRGDLTTALSPYWRNGAHIRKNTAIKIYNTIILDFVTGIHIDGVLCEENAKNGKLSFNSNIIAGSNGKVCATTNPSSFTTIRTWFGENKNDSVALTTGILERPYDYLNPDYRPTANSIALSNINNDLTVGNNPCANSTLNATFTTASNTSTIVGTCNGTLTITATSGTSPYQYSLNNGTFGSVNNFTALCNGIQNVQVKDNAGCFKNITTTIESPNNPCANSTLNATFTTTSNTSTIVGTCNGTLTITATSGTSPYQYSLNNGTFGSVNNFTALCNGIQNVQVKDNAGCFKNITTTIESPNNPCANSTLNATFTTTSNTSTIVGTCNGTLTITATSGTSPYQYSLNNGTFGSVNNFTALCNGIQNVQVKDNAGCFKNITTTIESPNNPCANSTLNATFTTTSNTSTIVGTCNGTLTITATSGTSPYQYSLNNGTFGSVNNFTALCNGIQNVQVKDNAGCFKNITTTIESPNNPCANSTLNATFTTTSNTSTIVGTCNGTLTITATSGTSPYQYSLNNGTFGSVNNFTALCNGIQNVQVKDNAGCFKNITTTIESPNNPCANSTLNATFTTTSNTSTIVGTCNGTLTITATGGISPYQYSLNNGTFGSVNNFTALCNGVQNVQVKDNAGCVKNITATIESPNNPCANSTLNATFTSISNTSTIVGTCNGTLTIIASSGTSPYQYSLNNGTFGSVNNFTALCNGVQNVQVKDNAGCVKNITATIESPNNPCANSTLNATFTSISNTSTIVGTCNGTLTIIASSGTSPYQYSLNNGTFGSVNNFTALCNGVQNVQVKDNAGCVKNITATIESPNNPCANSTLNATFTSISNTSTIVGTCNGTLTIIASSGTSPYQYSLNNGTFGSVNNFTALCNGVQNVQVKDNAGCVKNITATIESPNNPCANSTLNATFTSISNTSTIVGTCNGTLTIIASSGTSPYQYSLNNGTFGSVNNFTALCNGVQNVQVKDNAGCVKNITATIESPNNPCANSTLNATFTSISNTSTIVGTCNGTLTIIASSGTSPYQYSLNNGTFGSVNNFTALCNGVQNVQVKDNAGCVKSITVIIEFNAGNSAGISEIKNNKIKVYPNPFNDYITISIGNDKLSEVRITDILGKVIVNKKYFDETFKIDLSTLSTGTYIVTIKNNNTVKTEQIVK